MSARFPVIDSGLPTGGGYQGGGEILPTGVPGFGIRVDGAADGVADIDRGSRIASMGDMNLLNSLHGMNLRANAIDLGLALDQQRKSSVNKVIASI